MMSENRFVDTLLGFCTYNDIQTLVCDYVNRMFDEERKDALDKHWFLDDYPHLVDALNAAEGFLGDYWSSLLNFKEAMCRVFVPSDFVVAETSYRELRDGELAVSQFSGSRSFVFLREFDHDE